MLLTLFSFFCPEWNVWFMFWRWGLSDEWFFDTLSLFLRCICVGD